MKSPLILQSPPILQDRGICDWVTCWVMWPEGQKFHFSLPLDPCSLPAFKAHSYMIPIPFKINYSNFATLFKFSTLSCSWFSYWIHFSPIYVTLGRLCSLVYDGFLECLSSFWSIKVLLRLAKELLKKLFYLFVTATHDFVFFGSLFEILDICTDFYGYLAAAPLPP